MMRILHTSDWHLGARLRHVPRRGHLRARLQQIAGYLDEHRVDVMVISGDVFHKRHHRADELREAVGDVREAFGGFLLRGGTIVAISGNHDHEVLFDLLHIAQDMAAPADRQAPGPRQPGRLYLGSKPGLLNLADRRGQQVQFALLPYPTPERYLDGEGASVSSPEERHSRLQRGLLRRLDRICEGLRPELPSVLVAHTHVRGSRLPHSLYEIDHKDDVVFEAAHLPERFAYAAYGHIHMPQRVAEAEHIRYAGSIERLDRAERDDQKSVVLLDVVRGARERPAVLPLSATPMGCCVVREPEQDIKALSARYPDPQTLLYYALDLPPERDQEAVHRDIGQKFPNAIREDLVDAPGRIAPPSAAGVDPDGAATGLSARLRDVRGTTTEYLERELSDYPHKDRALHRLREIIDQIEREDATWSRSA